MCCLGALFWSVFIDERTNVSDTRYMLHTTRLALHYGVLHFILACDRIVKIVILCNVLQKQMQTTTFQMRVVRAGVGAGWWLLYISWSYQRYQCAFLHVASTSHSMSLVVHPGSEIVWNCWSNMNQKSILNDILTHFEPLGVLEMDLCLYFLENGGSERSRARFQVRFMAFLFSWVQSISLPGCTCLSDI